MWSLLAVVGWRASGGGSAGRFGGEYFGGRGSRRSFAAYSNRAAVIAATPVGPLRLYALRCVIAASIAAIARVIRDLGLRRFVPPEPLPEIIPDDVYCVTWLALV